MKRHSVMGSSHAFLLEIILNIFLFAVLLSVSLQLIMKAHSLTKETQVTYEAVDFCDNMASIYESGDGSLSSLAAQYPMGTLSDSVYRLNLNSDFEPVTDSDQEDTCYTLIMTLADPSTLSFSGEAADLVLTDADQESVYELRACHFSQAVPTESEVD